jgi:hypothetical protein
MNEVEMSARARNRCPGPSCTCGRQSTVAQQGCACGPECTCAEATDAA